MTKQTEKFYITTDVLTEGIRCAYCVPHSDNYDNVKRKDEWVLGPFSRIVYLLVDRDAFREKADAIKRAKEMQAKKIESLKKQILRIEAMEFK